MRRDFVDDLSLPFFRRALVALGQGRGNRVEQAFFVLDLPCHAAVCPDAMLFANQESTVLSIITIQGVYAIISNSLSRSNCQSRMVIPEAGISILFFFNQTKKR